MIKRLIIDELRKVFIILEVKMEEKIDLRIVKTKRAIQTNFLELLSHKPIDKVSVTELVKKAEISKGTFYLHYLDIYMTCIIKWLK